MRINAAFPPPPQGLYDPADERDGCGVGFVSTINGRPSREVVIAGISALKAVWHRGAVAADGKTGDGAGIMVQIPKDFFASIVARTGHEMTDHPVCVGMIFLPRTDYVAQERARAIVETQILKAGFLLYGWRRVPVDVGAVGERANLVRPEIEQVLFYAPEHQSIESLERHLFLVRRRIEAEVLAAHINEFYVCSFSARTLVYKGMFLAEQIDAFFPDLQDAQFVSPFILFHQRYSTNTFPQWHLAQPFHMLAHNGEINTLKGNVNWMRSHEVQMASSAFGDAGSDIKPVIQPGSSDSASLDAAFEVLVRAGRSVPMVKSLLIPEAWSKRGDTMPENEKAMYAYCNAVMEPWDGPAALVASDGRWVIAGLDRSGLRPLRYALSKSGLLALGSEAGMCPLDDEDIVSRGRVHPGRMVGINLDEGKFYTGEPLIEKLANAHDWQNWLDNLTDLDPVILPGSEPSSTDKSLLTRKAVAAGFSLEDMEVLLKPAVMEAKEPLGSMGDDTPLAVLSDQYRPLYHYFRQNFSQVTNPPIDPLREGRVMGLITRFKNLGNILDGENTQTGVLTLSSPVLTNGAYERLVDYLGKEDVAHIDCTFDAIPDSQNGENLADALERIRNEAARYVQNGYGHLVLSDEKVSKRRAAIPMALAVSGIHTRLTAEHLRSYCSLIVRAADVLDSHHFAVLIGVGATCVNAYLTQDMIANAQQSGQYGNLGLNPAVAQYKSAIENGLLKIMSKMGISVLSSYRGGCNFEALGLSRALMTEFFPGVPSRISGIGLLGLERKVRMQHQNGFMAGGDRLPIGGNIRVRAGQERHAYTAKTISALQTACKSGRTRDYAAYLEAVGAQKPAQLRDLLDFRPYKTAIIEDSVESVNELRKRFLTPGMSLGALSPEAHGALNIAMNRMGARSVSGEGGEDPSRYQPLPSGDNANSAVKQVASGRFGVTAQYLNECREIEIKIAQGAKPGEGGQLPGFKVNAMIARLRHSVQGVTLISPPPHHDIYSIEDLAQLIYDLKQINPDARIAVKLVAAAGIGAIAAGVAKAKADIITISGHSGGTGASPQSAIKYAGTPWELGLAEANQVLTLNGLRTQVRLRTDGGLRSGRDIVIAAMLGAEEFGIGTMALMALGCLMVRQCHTNTCPVGICTQDERLRAMYKGSPDGVVNLMTFLASDVRAILASLGAKTLNEVIGRSDLLAQVNRGSGHLDDLDLNPLLLRVQSGQKEAYCIRTERVSVSPSLDEAIIRDAAPFFSRREKMDLTYTVHNTDRSIGTRLSSMIYRNWGVDGLKPAHLTLNLKGAAGQSLGAFAVEGLKLILQGEANDYVGKGLSGAQIIVRPVGAAALASAENIIIGNTCLYGATKGSLFAAGQAGERFAVRNSGADAVVEGCGANGCEYMTGGNVVILGRVGHNFAAGMHGGMAWVYDPQNLLDQLINADTVYYAPLASSHWESACKALIERHAKETGSVYAKEILRKWEISKRAIKQVCPTEMLNKLDYPLDDRAPAPRQKA
jgi:glutamate synthase (NADPH) large chain